MSDQTPARKQINFSIVPDEQPGEPRYPRQLLLHLAHAVRFHAHLLRGDAALERELKEAEQEHVVRAPVRSRVVVRCSSSPT
jgi:hypothetical protein